MHELAQWLRERHPNLSPEEALQVADKLYGEACAAMEAEIARLTRERDEAEGSLAGLADCIDQELRENGPVGVEQVPSLKADMRPFVRRLVDYVRERMERAATREQAELLADNATLRAALTAARQWSWAKSRPPKP